MANGRRASEDIEWQNTKKLVDRRDKKSCQFEKCLSAKEFHQLIKGSPITLDRAHIFSASNHPELIYNPKNVITLRRFLHRRLDDYKNPINEQPLSYEENRYWWWRIKNHKIEKYDPEIDYELLLLSEIK